MNSSQRETWPPDISVSSAHLSGKQRDLVCVLRHPDFFRGTGVPHRWVLPIEFLPLRALSPEKIHQWEEQAGPQKVWTTRAISGTSCQGPAVRGTWQQLRIPVPCPVVQCHLLESRAWAAHITSRVLLLKHLVLLQAAWLLPPICCKVHLLTHQESLTKLLFLQQVRRMPPASRLLTFTSELQNIPAQLFPALDAEYKSLGTKRTVEEHKWTSIDVTPQLLFCLGNSSLFSWMPHIYLHPLKCHVYLFLLVLTLRDTFLTLRDTFLSPFWSLMTSSWATTKPLITVLTLHLKCCYIFLMRQKCVHGTCTWMLLAWLSSIFILKRQEKWVVLRATCLLPWN